MGKSRVELLAWVNALLNTQYSKIEQLGNGVSYCQIFDSIWGDVSMYKVKFDAKLEYEFIANFKVLQVAFDAHNVSKSIPIEQLVKCKLQDNLQFLQWAHSYHQQHHDGQPYDASARQNQPPSTSHTSINSTTSTPPRQRPKSSYSSNPTSTLLQLQSQIQDLSFESKQQAEQTKHLTETILTLEHERDFYFNKLRDIEILIQQEASLGHASDLMTLIQQIMYTTEEGFVLPNSIADESVDVIAVSVPEPTQTIVEEDPEIKVLQEELETL